MKKVNRLVALMKKCSSEQIVQALLEGVPNCMLIVGEVIENVDDDTACEIFDVTSTYKDKVLVEFLTKIVMNEALANVIMQERALVGKILEQIDVDELAKTAAIFMSKEKTDSLKQKLTNYGR